MKSVTSHNSQPRNCSPCEKDFSWGSDTLLTLTSIPMLESRHGVSKIDAGEIDNSFSSKLELELGGAPKDCEKPG